MTVCMATLWPPAVVQSGGYLFEAALLCGATRFWRPATSFRRFSPGLFTPALPQ